MENNIARLADDHRRAARLAAVLATQPEVAEVLPADTNLVLFRLHDQNPVPAYLARLEKQGIRASGFGGQWVRFVLHLDVSEDMVARTEEAVMTR